MAMSHGQVEGAPWPCMARFYGHVVPQSSSSSSRARNSTSNLYFSFFLSIFWKTSLYDIYTTAGVEEDDGEVEWDRGWGGRKLQQLMWYTWRKDLMIAEELGMPIGGYGVVFGMQWLSTQTPNIISSTFLLYLCRCENAEIGRNA